MSVASNASHSLKGVIELGVVEPVLSKRLVRSVARTSDQERQVTTVTPSAIPQLPTGGTG